MKNNLTDNLFWKNFWESKKDLIFKVKADYTFHESLGRLIKERSIKTAIELGGFPGYYSIFLRKFHHLKTTLFDYYIHQPIITNLLEHNDLKPDDIKIIEADLFSFPAQENHDLVCSFGLIEHFEDTKDIIERHLGFLKPEGTLFITLPNFNGVNGWVQKTFDRYNYDKHNMSSMDLNLLKETAIALGLKEVRTCYFGGFSTWLENKDQKSTGAKLLVKCIWYLGKVVSKIIPMESKLLSPYIILEAKK